MVRSLEEWRRGEATALPAWVKPQLTKLVDAPPEGVEWLHEIKFDGYRMHARLDRGAVRLLTRTGLDWTHKYPLPLPLPAVPKGAWRAIPHAGAGRRRRFPFSPARSLSRST